MYLRTLILAVLIITFASVAAAQNEQSQTILINSADSLRSECDIGARIDAAFFELNNLPNNLSGQIYVIVYRGSEDLPANQTNSYLQEMIDRLKQPVKFRKYDASKIVYIDGGFRKNERLSVDFWLVPLGGIIPQPSETVENPKLPKNKAYLVDKIFNDVISSAYIVPKEFEISTEEDELVEPTEVEEETENFEVNSEENEESEESFNSFSNYFGTALESDASLRGVIIYYADGENYNLDESSKLMTEFLQVYKEKFDLNLKRIKLVYGGYREETETEYWIVPKGAKEPQAKPQEKNLVNEQ